VSTSAGKKSTKAAAKRPAPAKKKLPVKKAAPAKPARPAPKTRAKKPPASKKPIPAKKASARSATPAPKAGKAVTPRHANPAKPAAKAAVPAKKPAPVAKKHAPAPAPAPAVAKVPASAPQPSAGPPFAVPPGVVPRKPGRGTPKYFVAPVQAPLPPPTSRFADRFAPPRPPTREMNKLENDTPRERHKSDPKLANAWKTKAGRDLSDAEVLAMPDSEYMNEKQIDFFRMKLVALKEDLLSNAGETTEHLREDTSIVPDPADRATIEEEHALELRTRDRERKLLKKISQSLARLESGDYGFCDETGEPIGLGRLIARPTATLSLEAQQRRELKQKMFGD
jgi:DnaK suppressor protein